MAEKVVVAGAGFGGVNAALRLARKGHEVTLLDRNSFHTYTPGLIDLIRGRSGREKNSLNLDSFFEGTSVNFSQENILHIEPEKSKIETNRNSHRFDYLVLSLGSEPATFGLDVSAAEGCYTLDGAQKLAEEAEGAEDAIVIGSGYVGVEVATELDEKGIDTTVLDQATRPMPNSNTKGSELTLDYLNRKDIAFRGGTEVIEVNSGSVRTSEGEKIDADLVVWSGGIQASKTVQNSFNVDHSGLEVNSGLSSKEYDNVFAIGDNADYDFKKTAQNAEKQGVLVAENIDRDDSEPLEPFQTGTIPLVISLGDTGIFHYGDRSYMNRLFRILKDLVRIRYFFKLKREKWKLKLGI